MNLDASSKERSAEEKADHYVKIAETYMMNDETVDAEVGSLHRRHHHHRRRH